MRIDDPVLIFAVIMLIMLVAPLVFSKLRIPGLIGLVVAGIATGPHALGLFSLDGTFELLGKVGLLYLMFLAGLEIEFNEFVRHRRSSLIFGAFTFLIPQVLGAVGARVLFDYPWPKAILLASMFASHTLISFPIAGRLGILRNRAITTSVGGTIFTDTAALTVLVVVAESVTAQITGLFWVRQIALLLILAWFGLWMLPRIGYWFFRVAAPDAGTEFIFIITAVFSTSYLAHLCGAEPIIGAFLAGLSLNRLVPSNSPLMSRLEFVGHTLFIPFFLISVGMRVDVRVALLDISSLAISAYMIAAVILSKWLAADCSMRVLRFSSAERGVLFGLSINQAAATLAAVMVGQRVGLFDDAILNGTILMILVTCMLGPWATQHYGQLIAMTLQQGKEQDVDTPARIMVPLAHPESAPFLLDLALLLRGKTGQASIYPLTVVQDGLQVESRIEQGERLLGVAVARAAAAGVPVSPVTELDVTISGGILRAIREYRISTIIMGWSPRFQGTVHLLRWLPQEILNRSSAMLLLVQSRQALGAYRRVILLVPPILERAPGFRTAVRSALSLASNSELDVLASSDAQALLHPSFGRARPASTPRFHTLAVRENMCDALTKTHPVAQDLVVLLTARRGGVGWQPQTERLPAQIAQRFPKADFIVIYPPIQEVVLSAVTRYTDTDHSADSFVRATHSAIAVAERNVLTTLKDLIARNLGCDAREAANVSNQLLGREPVELADGVQLLHCHVPHVQEPSTFLVTRAEGLVVGDWPAAPHAVFALLSPEDAPSPVHLHALRRIAQTVYDEHVQTALRQVSTFEALEQALNSSHIE